MPITIGTALEDWDSRIVDETGGVAARWTWEEFRALPAEEVAVEIHCVTKWSKLGTRGEGVSLDTLLEGIDTAAEFAVALSGGGYATNLPLADLLDGRRWVAFGFEGRIASPSTVARRGCWSRACTSGGAPSGCGACGSATRTSRASGRASATTTTAIRGVSSAPGRLTTVRWLVATVAETAWAVTLRLDVPDWLGHRPGQHVDVRLTAEDGYSAQRSYSIASPPAADRLELTVERIDDGEVSPYLTSVAVSDQIEVRGPIGGWFVWDGDHTAPVLLVGGGSGVVPHGHAAPPRRLAQHDRDAPRLLGAHAERGDLPRSVWRWWYWSSR
jgi:Oxidoreductase FAD-binding domain